MEKIARGIIIGIPLVFTVAFLIASLPLYAIATAIIYATVKGQNA